MFENISFLFLFAMALFSWAVLCLQHAVEILRRSASDYHVELYTERPAITFEPHMSRQPSEPSPLSGAFDFAMSFWAILALTFGLSKVFQLAERKVKMYLKCGETLDAFIVEESRSSTENPAAEQKLPLYQPSKNQVSQLNQESLDPVVVNESTALKEQLSSLHSHCMEMRELLHELRMTKSSISQGSIQSGDDNMMTVEQSEESVISWNGTHPIAESMPASSQPNFTFHQMPDSTHPSQNIYITNSHIQFGGPVFCSENTVSMELCKQAYARKKSEFLQVWEKFISGPKERPMITGMRWNNILP